MQARPNRRPARTWRRSRSDRGGGACSRRPTKPPADGSRLDLVVGVGVRAERDADREEDERDRDDMGEEPGRAELRGVPEDRSEAEEDRRREPDAARYGQPAERPPRQADVHGAQEHRDGADVRADAPDGHERHQEDRGQRRERQERARRRWVVGQLAQGVDVLHPVVAQREAATVDRVVDHRRAVQEGERLPHEVVVVAVAAREPVGREGERDQAGADGERGQPIEPVEQDVQATGASDALCYAPKHLIARWRPIPT